MLTLGCHKIKYEFEGLKIAHMALLCLKIQRCVITDPTTLKKLLTIYNYIDTENMLIMI